jgi:hypothetical protein
MGRQTVPHDLGKPQHVHAADSNSAFVNPTGSPRRPAFAMSHTDARISCGSPVREKNRLACSPDMVTGGLGGPGRLEAEEGRLRAAVDPSFSFSVASRHHASNTPHVKPAA